jgi:hypothetical protein
MGFQIHVDHCVPPEGDTWSWTLVRTYSNIEEQRLQPRRPEELCDVRFTSVFDEHDWEEAAHSLPSMDKGARVVDDPEHDEDPSLWSTPGG